MGSYIESNTVNYKQVFKDLNTHIAKINNDNLHFHLKDNFHVGYLVNYKTFTDFEKGINELYGNANRNCAQNLNQNRNVYEINIIAEQNLLDTESFDDAINNIKKNENINYIIIDKKTRDKICKRKHFHKIEYEISPEYIILNPKKSNQTIFHNKKDNIINRSLLKAPNENNTNKNITSNNNNSIKGFSIYNENWPKIYHDAKNYYNNEIDINKKLHSGESRIYQGYLVDKEWVDEWKKYSFYDILKTNFLEKNKYDEYEIKNLIIKKQAKNNLNYNEIKKVDSYIINNDNQIKEISLKPYVLLNATFLRRFTTIKIYPKTFIISYQNISLQKSDGQLISFKTNNNIITNNNETQKYLNLINNPYNKKELYRSFILEHLIRFPFFKINLNYHIINSPKNNINSAYLIKKDIINKFIQIYDLKNLIGVLFNNNLFDERIIYNYFNINEARIHQFLNEKKIDYINQIKKYEIPGGIKFSESENNFIPYLINNQQGSLQYFDNFEIIDQDFATFLIQKFYNGLKMFQTQYALIEDKIFLSINFNQKVLYEIVSFNKEGSDFIPEYVLNIMKMNNNYIYDIKTYNNLILNTLFNNGIKKLISKGNKINIGNDMILEFIPINTNLRKSANFNQNIKLDSITYDNNRPILEGHVLTEINKNAQHLNNNYNTFDNISSSHIRLESKKSKEFSKSRSLILPDQVYYLIDKELFNLFSSFLTDEENKEVYLGEIPMKNSIIVHENEQNKIKLPQKIINGKNIIYPINLEIIDKSIFDKFSNIDKNHSINNLVEEINLTRINGGFAFMLKNNKSIINNDKIIFIYSISLEPIALYEFNNIEEKNNAFKAIIEDSICKNIIQNPEVITHKFNSYYYKISNKEYKNYPLNSSSIIGIKTNKNINQKTVALSPPNYDRLLNNINDVNNRTKVLMLLAISQIYIKANKLEKIKLINPKWLEEYDYSKIKSFINKNVSNIKTIWNHEYDINSLSPIIKTLDFQTLKSYDSKMNFNSNISWEASPEIMKLSDKDIYLYKNVVIMNEKLFNLLYKYFNIFPSNDDISQIHLKDQGDLIIFKDYQLNNSGIQNYILAGYIDKNKTQYHINYLFDYVDKGILEKELEVIIQYGIINYINNRTINSEEKFTFSPIFINEKIIGNCYILKKGHDYTKYVNYSFYLNNEKIKTVIYLYMNKALVIKKITELNNYKDEEFYLFRKEVISDIKAENNYDIIKRYFAGKVKLFPPNDKEIYSIIKRMSQKDLEDLNNNLKTKYIPKDLPKNYEIDISPIVNPNNSNESFYILKDFELVEKSVSNVLFKEKYPYHILKCSFVGNNMIAFHYSNNKFNNKNTFYVISEVDENYNISNLYLLVYYKKDYYKKHFDQIKYNLVEFFKNIGFINNVAPLTNHNYSEIGIAIKLTQGNDEYCPPNPLNISDIRQDYNSKPLIGLENIGATCYMNATLQCLCNIKKFVDYFKYSKNLEEIVKADIDKKKLCSAFKLLIENIYPYHLSMNYLKSQKTDKASLIKNNKQNNHYAPRNFKEIISRMNPLFKGIAANDAKDLVNFLVMTLHDELNKAKQVQSTVKDDYTGEKSFQEQKNKEIMFNNFIKNFKKNYISIISDLFYALNCNYTECTNCKTTTYNYQIYFFLIFPLEEIRKFNLDNGVNRNQINNQSNVVDIYDCFNYDKRINYMTGDNAMYCVYCKRTSNCMMKTLLTTGPEILIIILNRGKGIQFDVKINFYLELNLKDYIELNDTGYEYELFGVITHIGESGMGGHFIAYCKEFWNNQWLKFNDAIVSPVTDFKKEVIDFAMPYLLFYQKKEKKILLNNNNYINYF